MRTSPDTRGWLSGVVLLFALSSGWQARADLLTSDSFGVRSNTNPTSLTANFRQFDTTIVPDGSIQESADGFDLNGSGLNQITFELFSSPFFNEPGHILPTPCPSNQACLGNGARVNLGVEGHAFLREPSTFEFSDRITIVFSSTGVSGSNIVDVTITMDSDPLSGNFSAPAGTIIDENGRPQDVSSRLFNLASDPNHFGDTVLDSNSTGFPFHVFMKSDADLTASGPEPGSVILMATAVLGWIVCRQVSKRPRRQN